MFVPKTFLKQIYTNGSLANTDDGVRFELKNRLLDAKLTGVRRVSIGDRDVSLDGATLVLEDGRMLAPPDVSPNAPVPFDLGDVFVIRLRTERLAPGTHPIVIEFDSEPFGRLTIEVEDAIAVG
jgi:hydroxymethylglutaryl-CoA reductase (NADPH)